MEWLSRLKAAWSRVFQRKDTQEPGMRGFYSEKAAENHHATIWSTPDGAEVMVTLVCHKDYQETRLADYEFDDVQYVGPIVKFVRPVKRGEVEKKTDV